jgi:hypothetical protein
MAMIALRRRMRDDLPLRGVAPKTQPGYREAVTPLAQDYQRAPEQISAEAIRQYCLSLINEQKVAERT